MKTKGTLDLEKKTDRAVLVSKSNKSTKAERVSKPKSTPKYTQKATHIKPVPAKGLELDNDDDEEESGLENELEEEKALNKLAEQSHDPLVETDEDVSLPKIPSRTNF